MSSLSTRLGLVINATADPFALNDFTTNYGILDAKPGIHICTAATRPTWGSNQNGMQIYETDTDLIWAWDGSAWQRYIAKGWLATASITADASTSSTSYVTAITQAVTVAAGNRRHQISIAAPRVFNTNGLTQLAIFRGANLLREWISQGWTGATVPNQPRGNFATHFDLPTSGAQTYTLQYRAVSGTGGTSTIAATAANPATLSIVEV